MATVIANEKLDKHNVNPYTFKVLTGDSVPSKVNEKGDTFTADSNPKARITDVDASALSTSSKDSLIESLMQKTDEMSSNFIKLQMKLESKESEFEIALNKVKEEAFNEGVQAGLAQEKENSIQSSANSVSLFSASVLKLEESSKEYESALEGIKNGLISAALDISQEVVKVELDNNSNEIAKVLSDELIKELQSASKITLKVNPNNHGAISEHIGNVDNITIVSDRAVSEGGVIVMSDAGNIDAQISKRFERVKRAALSE